MLNPEKFASPVIIVKIFFPPELMFSEFAAKTVPEKQRLLMCWKFLKLCYLVKKLVQSYQIVFPTGKRQLSCSSISVFSGWMMVTQFTSENSFILPF